MSTVAVLGASGFVGSHVCRALRDRDVGVQAVRAPRLSTSGRDAATLATEIDGSVGGLPGALAGADAVVNAAGIAAASSHGDDELYGANALLPAVVAKVCADAGVRFVHVSSAAVQGRRPVLDETAELAPFSPYSDAKAIGEQLVLQRPGAVVFRPTSVHGAARPVSRTLARFAASRFASVAGHGENPTPQVQVANVADAVAFLATTAEAPPPIVLHPDEGITTGELIRLLGGREPIHVPRAPARVVVGVLFAAGRVAPAFAGIARRVEMLWFGQRQEPGWLRGRWKPVVGLEGWTQLT